jgi:hypothetical protein
VSHRGVSIARSATLCALLALGSAARAGEPAEPVEPAEPAEMRSDLAAMIQQVVLQTRISVQMSQSAQTHVHIHRVNGRSVCDPLARADVARLQRSFDEHPKIYRNIGPAMIRVTDRAGQKSVFDPAIAAVGGTPLGCSTIYVSVHD